MIEALGIMASVIVLMSFVINGEKRIRAVNIIGASMFVIYGLIIGSFSVWMLNGVLIGVHLYYLSKI